MIRQNLKKSYRNPLTMEPSEIIKKADELIDAYRTVLLVDPFVRLKLEIMDGDFISSCIQDDAPLTWILRLNPALHLSVEDIQYSVVEAIINILFYPLETADMAKRDEVKKALVSRLATAIATLLPTELEQPQEDVSQEKDGDYVEPS
jgi:hypothetical protein